jgi:hypothetical protein
MSRVGAAGADFFPAAGSGLLAQAQPSKSRMVREMNAEDLFELGRFIVTLG